MLTRNNTYVVVSASFESNHLRRLAEEYVIQLFAPLPYSLTTAIAANNEQHFFATHDVAAADAPYLRLFPSGSIGVNITKPLRDDKNGVISPAIWQCTQADPKNRVRMTFITKNCSWSFESTTDRFAWFNGLVPHKTELMNPPEVKSTTTRVHHSSYIKIEHEQLALIPMSTKTKTKLLVTEVESLTPDSATNVK